MKYEVSYNCVQGHSRNFYNVCVTYSHNISFCARVCVVWLSQVHLC